MGNATRFRRFQATRFQVQGCFILLRGRDTLCASPYFVKFGVVARAACEPRNAGPTRAECWRRAEGAMTYQPGAERSGAPGTVNTQDWGPDRAKQAARRARIPRANTTKRLCDRAQSRRTVPVRIVGGDGERLRKRRSNGRVDPEGNERPEPGRQFPDTGIECKHSYPVLCVLPIEYVPRNHDRRRLSRPTLKCTSIDIFRAPVQRQDKCSLIQNSLQRAT